MPAWSCCEHRRADLGDGTLHGNLLVPNAVGTRQHLVHVVRVCKGDESETPMGLLRRGGVLGDVGVLAWRDVSEQRGHGYLCAKNGGSARIS